MQTKNYYEAAGISSSMIKDFEWMSPLHWKETYLDRIGEKENKLHFTRGSYLDCCLLSPEILEESFYVGDFEKPISEAVQALITAIYNKLLLKYESSTCLIDFSDLEDAAVNGLIIVCATEANYGNGSYSPERIVKEVRAKGKEYFDFLCAAEGRIIISLEDQMNALAKKDSLLTDERSIAYFEQQKGEMLLHHLQIFTKDGRKGELDIVRICPSERTIYITDLKTTHSSFAFLENVRKFSYATQLGFYKDLFIELLKDQETATNTTLTLNPDLLKYNFVCQNIVIDDKQKIPYIYRYRDIDIDFYKYGSDFLDFSTRVQRYKRGWYNTWKIIEWHMKYHLWDYPKEHYDKGYLTINLITGQLE